MTKQINIIPTNHSADYKNALSYIAGEDRIGGIDTFNSVRAELEAQGLVCVNPANMQTIMSLPKEKILVARVSCMWCGGDDLVAYRLPGETVTESSESAAVIDHYSITAGEELCETAAMVRIEEKLTAMDLAEENKHHPGWCNKCQSHCYGDCEF